MLRSGDSTTSPDTLIDRLFAQIDVDGSGTISLEELSKWYESDIGPSEGARELFAELDDDGSGLIDTFEFKEILVELADADWVLAGDESGRPYYINSRTRVSRWELPGQEGVNEWLASMLQNGDSVDSVTEHLSSTSVSDETSDAVYDGTDHAILSVDELFDVVDTDRSGNISFDEFEAFWQQRRRIIGDSADDGKVAQARSFFTDLDEDGSGLLDREEFRVIMAEMVASDWTPRLDRASGRTFYVNLKTQAKRWTLPDDDEVDSFIAEHLNHHSDGGGAIAEASLGTVARDELAKSRARVAELEQELAATRAEAASAQERAAALEAGGAVRTSSARGGGSGSSDPELDQLSQFEQGAQMVVAAQSIVVRKGHKKGSAHVVELKQVRTTREDTHHGPIL